MAQRNAFITTFTIRRRRARRFPHFLLQDMDGGARRCCCLYGDSHIEALHAITQPATGIARLYAVKIHQQPSRRDKGQRRGGPAAAQDACGTLDRFAGSKRRQRRHYQITLLITSRPRCHRTFEVQLQGEI